MRIFQSRYKQSEVCQSTHDLRGASGLLLLHSVKIHTRGKMNAKTCPMGISLPCSPVAALPNPILGPGALVPQMKSDATLPSSSARLLPFALPPGQCI